MIEAREVVYVVDENLTPHIASFLKSRRYDAEVAPLGTPDPQILVRLSRRYPVHPVLVTGDHKMDARHRRAIIDSRVSVAWLHANQAGAVAHMALATAFVIAMHATLESALDPVYFDLRLEASTTLVNVAISPRTL